MSVIIMSGTKHLLITHFTWVQQTPVAYLWQKKCYHFGNNTWELV